MPAEPPETYVVDANVVAAWSLNRPWSAKAAQFRQPQFLLKAPDLIVPEVGNVLWLNVRDGVLTAAEAEEAYLAVTTFVELVSGVHLRFTALELAVRLGHSVYDCFYLALAMREKAVFLTADRQLASRANKIGLQSELLAAI